MEKLESQRGNWESLIARFVDHRLATRFLPSTKKHPVTSNEQADELRESEKIRTDSVWATRDELVELHRRNIFLFLADVSRWSFCFLRLSRADKKLTLPYRRFARTSGKWNDWSFSMSELQWNYSEIIDTPSRAKPSKSQGPKSI